MHLPRSFEEVIVLAEQSGHKVQGRGRRGDDVRVGGLELHVWPVGTAFVAVVVELVGDSALEVKDLGDDVGLVVPGRGLFPGSPARTSCEARPSL